MNIFLSRLLYLQGASTHSVALRKMKFIIKIYTQPQKKLLRKQTLRPTINAEPYKKLEGGLGVNSLPGISRRDCGAAASAGPHALCSSSPCAIPVYQG